MTLHVPGIGHISGGEQDVGSHLDCGSAATIVAHGAPRGLSQGEGGRRVAVGVVRVGGGVVRSSVFLTGPVLFAVLGIGCGEAPKREAAAATTCEPATLVACRCGQAGIGRAQCLDSGENITFCDCSEQATQAAFNSCDGGDQVACPCMASPGFSLCDVTGVYMSCTCTNPQPPSQGTGGGMGGGPGSGGMGGGTGGGQAMGSGGFGG